MCEYGDSVLVVLVAPARQAFAADRCIVPLVTALNNGGLTTVASCCGHGYRPGVIALTDDRQIIVARDYDEAQQIHDLFPFTIHGEHREGLIP